MALSLRARAAARADTGGRRPWRGRRWRGERTRAATDRALDRSRAGIIGTTLVRIATATSWSRGPTEDSVLEHNSRARGVLRSPQLHGATHRQVVKTTVCLSCRQATSPAAPRSGNTADTTKTAANPDTAPIWPETNEPVTTPKSVNAQNVAIAVPRSAGPARSIASA